MQEFYKFQLSTTEVHFTKVLSHPGHGTS